MPRDRCACPSCYGLKEFMLEVTGRDYGLPAAPGHGPTTRALVEQLEDPCTGEMTCQCSKCRAAVSRLVKRGPRGGGDQPWNVKAAA